LCPHAIFLPGHFDQYQDMSARIHAVFNSFTPLVEGIALDEAFLDVTGARRLFGQPPDIARAVRERVRDETGLDCSVGVARSKLLAKLASKEAKPRVTASGVQGGAGVVVGGTAEELRFLHRKPVRALWGVGPATAARLSRLGVSTVGDLAHIPEASLVAALGRAAGHGLHELAWARDRRRVEPSRPAKSIGHEETYAEDHHRLGPLQAELVRMADAVSARLRAAHLEARTVTLKVRFADFTTITRSHTQLSPFATAQVMTELGLELLSHVDPAPGVRLLGLSASGLAPAAGEQLSLEQAAGGWRAAAGAIDEIRLRFGDAAVGPATLAGGASLRVKRAGDTQWGPAAAAAEARRRRGQEPGPP
jgi:DNA polymerase-4